MEDSVFENQVKQRKNETRARKRETENEEKQCESPTVNHAWRFPQETSSYTQKNSHVQPIQFELWPFDYLHQ